MACTLYFSALDAKIITWEIVTAGDVFPKSLGHGWAMVVMTFSYE